MVVDVIPVGLLTAKSPVRGSSFPGNEEEEEEEEEEEKVLEEPSGCLLGLLPSVSFERGSTEVENENEEEGLVVKTQASARVGTARQGNLALTAMCM